MTERLSIGRYRELVLEEMSEQDFLNALIAHAIGADHHHPRWLVMHPRPAMRADGSYRTATQGYKGWPDVSLVCLVEELGAFYVELKAKGKYPSHDQKRWLMAKHRAGEEVWLAYPTDLPLLKDRLDGKPPPGSDSRNLTAWRRFASDRFNTQSRRWKV